MIQNLQLTRDDPVIHLKAYGGVKIKGVDKAEVVCEIDAPQLATLVEEDGHVYITVNASCSIVVPEKASLEIEKGMGSIKITGVRNKIRIEKALGNLVLNDVAEIKVEKIGGNFAVHGAAGAVRVEKVGGNLFLSDLESFKGEKIGGDCKVKSVRGDFSLEKMGGEFTGQDIDGILRVERVGGSFTARAVVLTGSLRAGGEIRLVDFELAGNQFEVKAGGDIHLELGEGFKGANFVMRSGGHDIRIKLNEDDISMTAHEYEYAMEGTESTVEIAAGGAIALTELADFEEDIVGDLSGSFDYEESAFSELIRERVESATRRSEAKVKAAEVRLDQIRERVEKHREFNVNVGSGGPEQPEQPVPPVSRPVGKKGATDEERLMILKMLQEKKITVDEAEQLFKALEE